MPDYDVAERKQPGQISGAPGADANEPSELISGYRQVIAVACEDSTEKCTQKRELAFNCGNFGHHRSIHSHLFSLSFSLRFLCWFPNLINSL